MLATSSTGNNFFQLGLEDVGVGIVTATAGVVSTAGSGAQSFILGNVSAETLTGSNTSGALNFYDVVGSATAAGGSTFTITDFGSTEIAYIFLVGRKVICSLTPTRSIETVTAAVASKSLPNGGSIVTLTDGTQITFGRRQRVASDLHGRWQLHQLQVRDCFKSLFESFGLK